MKNEVKNDGVKSGNINWYIPTYGKTLTNPYK